MQTSPCDAYSFFIKNLDMIKEWTQTMNTFVVLNLIGHLFLMYHMKCLHILHDHGGNQSFAYPMLNVDMLFIRVGNRTFIQDKH